MYVKMTRTIVTPAEIFSAGVVYDVGPGQGGRWIEGGKAKPTDDQPAAVQTLSARIHAASGRPALFLPPAGMEFGHEVMTHVRIVHFNKAAFKVVCCRPGNEVLYPTANMFFTEWSDPVPDEYRVGTARSAGIDWGHIVLKFPTCIPVEAGGLTKEEALCCIAPEKTIPLTPKIRGLRADVVLGIRHRQFWTVRNWKYWQYVADRLREKGVTFSVVGAKETSESLIGQLHHSGDYDTDAAVELLQGCKLYVGTDCGASHLAATVGVPMLVFREAKSGAPDLTARMQMVNPHPVEVVPEGWSDPAAVVAAALALLEK